MTTPPRQPPKPASVANPSAASSVTVQLPTAKPLGSVTVPLPPARPAASPTATPSVNQAETTSGTQGGAANSAVELKQTWDEQEVVNSIIRGDHFNSNLMNKYNNITYSWRLFCMPDNDYLYEGTTPTDIKEFYNTLDKYKQVTIAQSGVTGYNISEVEMSSVFGETTARGSQFTDITMKILEPNGVSFLDALREAAREAGIFNYIDFFYYLELTFKGYDAETGEIVLNPFSDLPNGGRWVWTVKINDIEVNLNSGGGQYKLSMLPMNESALDAEYATCPDTMLVRGKTVGEFFDNLEKSINEAWNRRLVETPGKEGFITHKFNIHGLPANGLKPPTQEEKTSELLKAGGITGKNKWDVSKIGKDTDPISSADRQGVQDVKDAQDIATGAATGFTGAQVKAMELYPDNEDWNNIRTHNSFILVDPNKNPQDKDGNLRTDIEAAPKDAVDLPTANVGRGTPISEIIQGVMAASEKGQKLARDTANADPQSADETKDTVNAKGFRECMTWQVIPEVQFNKKGDKKYDFYTNRYGRTIVWHIYPRIDQEPILSHRQISDAFDPKLGKGVQEKTLAALAARGFLPKRYDYLFTGLNTEVTNFDMSFNFAWQVMLPRFENYYHDQSLQHTRVNRAVLLDQIDANFDSQLPDWQKKKDDYLKDQTKDAAEGKKLVAEGDALIAVKKARDEAQAQAIKERQDAETRAKSIFPDAFTRTNEQDYQREFIETVLDDNRNQTKSGYSSRIPLVPISFAGGDQAKQDVGPGTTGQWHNGRQLYGAILNQVYGTTTGRFQQIDLEIRGDPFWLGYGTYEKAIQHNSDVMNTGKDLAYHNVGQNCFMFRFKYPADVDDSGSIVLKDNETVTGVYKVNGIKSTFKGGQFGQTLSAIRMPLIDLFTSIYGLKDGEGDTDQAKPVQTKQEAALLNSATVDTTQAGVTKP